MQWNEFQNIVCSAFGGLRNDHELTDVTLVCRGGEQLKAHKIVLASGSPFFMDLFKRSAHPHPLLYLRGLGVEDLAAVLELLYTGEANILSENLDTFLSLADELQLRDFTTVDSRETKTSWQPEEKQTLAADFGQSLPFLERTIQSREKTSQTEEEPTLSDFENSLMNKNLQRLNNQIKPMLSEESANNPAKSQQGELKNVMKLCKVCGKEEELVQNMIKHIEANHITGATKQTCNLCEKTYKRRNALLQHISNIHIE